MKQFPTQLQYLDEAIGKMRSAIYRQCKRRHRKEIQDLKDANKKLQEKIAMLKRQLQTSENKGPVITMEADVESDSWDDMMEQREQETRREILETSEESSDGTESWESSEEQINETPDSESGTESGEAQNSDTESYEPEVSETENDKPESSDTKSVESESSDTESAQITPESILREIISQEPVAPTTLQEIEACLEKRRWFLTIKDDSRIWRNLKGQQINRKIIETEIQKKKTAHQISSPIGSRTRRKVKGKLKISS